MSINPFEKSANSKKVKKPDIETWIHSSLDVFGIKDRNNETYNRYKIPILLSNNLTTIPGLDYYPINPAIPIIIR